MGRPLVFMMELQRILGSLLLLSVITTSAPIREVLLSVEEDVGGDLTPMQKMVNENVRKAKMAQAEAKAENDVAQKNLRVVRSEAARAVTKLKLQKESKKQSDAKLKATNKDKEQADEKAATSKVELKSAKEAATRAASKA